MVKFQKLFILFCFLVLTSCNRDTNTYALIETDMGNMKVMLYDFTPGHKANFIELAEKGYYDGLLFHRCMPGFMIQGGDPDSRTAQPGQRLGNGGPGYTIPAEIGAPHFRGALAAARIPDGGNPERASSGSQFFIVQGIPVTAQELDRYQKTKGIKYNEAQIKLYTEIGGYPSLDADYSVFGEVVEGIEVVDKINALERDPSNRPVKDVKMSVKILK